jgi:uncharacterized membrane protein YadS
MPKNSHFVFTFLGLALLAIGTLSMTAWWKSVDIFIRGSIPLIFIITGVIALTYGFRQVKASGDKARISRLNEFLLKEDYWSIWIGLGFVLVGISNISGDFGLLQLMAINPGGLKWDSIGQLMDHFGENFHLYFFQFIVWSLIFASTCRVMGIAIKDYLLSFTFIYFISIIIFSIGGWKDASSYNLEPPLVALILGLIITNTFKLPQWMDAGFRVEYYVKIGIVLLGATFPITLVITAGPVAIAQASFVSLLGCLTIYFVGTRFFNLDRRLAAVLSVGGSVCGVSASMAIAAAVGAKKEHIYTSVTLVVIWALIMIVFLPFMSKILELPPGVAGAWIGTSEFADAAGFAAASAYGKMAGNEDAAIKAFTLMKVIGRDLWIGIWALVWAIVATTVWDKKETGAKPDKGEIWRRFPKFVIGFFIASIIVTFISESYSAKDFVDVVKPNLMDPISSIRGWVFIFCFLSIGLTTRFRDLKSVNLRTFTPFTIGVIVNVVAGFILSVYVFGDYWGQL